MRTGRMIDVLTSPYRIDMNGDCGSSLSKLSVCISSALVGDARGEGHGDSTPKLDIVQLLLCLRFVIVSSSP